MSLAGPHEGCTLPRAGCKAEKTPDGDRTLRGGTQPRGPQAHADAGHSAAGVMQM